MKTTNTQSVRKPESFRAGAKKGLPVVGLLVFGGLLFAGCVWSWRWAKATPSLALKDVVVTGNERAQISEIVRLTGLSYGKNLLTIDVPAIEKAILTHPWVESVVVSRRFPNRVNVEVVEHVPVAWVALGDLYLVNSKGKPFKKVTSQESLDLPLLTGLDRDVYLNQPEESVQSLSRALTLAEAYSHRPEAKHKPLSEIRILNDGYVLVVGQGEEIRLGAKDAVERLSQLSVVSEALMRHGLSSRVIHLDNRVRPGWVTVKLAAPSSERKGAISQ